MSDQIPASIPLAPTPAIRSQTSAPDTDKSALYARLSIPVAAVALALGGVFYANAHWNSWTADAALQTTDDAAVGADMSTLSARVAGNIKSISVDDYQQVSKGSLIAEIDPSEYDATLALATANLDAAISSRANLANQETLQGAAIAAAEAGHRSALAAQDQTALEFKRQQSLGQASTEQRLQQAQAAYLQAQALVTSTAAAIDQQKAQLLVLRGQESLLDAQIEAQKANQATAKLHQDFTRIYAPFDGVAGKKAVHVGDYVSIGSGVITVVPIPSVYVTANFKETQLARMATGQAVDVHIDTFPGSTFRGRVGKLAPASGATFALLPPDNATGNYTKVVQRVPVRIELEDGQPLLGSLRPGMSAVVSVETARPSP